MTEETNHVIQKFPEPTSKRKLQKVIGLVNWDRRFIPNLPSRLTPLHALLKKDVKFTWKEEHQKAIMEIKQEFMNTRQLYIIRKD